MIVSIIDCQHLIDDKPEKGVQSVDSGKNETEARLEEGRKDCQVGEGHEQRQGQSSGHPGGLGECPAAQRAGPGEQGQPAPRGCFRDGMQTDLNVRRES